MQLRPEDNIVAVSIVNYRSAELVLESLPSLLSELASFKGSKVVVVDNASPGDDADRLEQAIKRDDWRDRVRLVRSPRNGGFAAGNNLAFEALRASELRPDCVLLLNPDACVRPGAIRELVRAMAERERAGVVGAAIRSGDGRERYGAFLFPTAMREFASGTGLSMFLRIWPITAKHGETPAPIDWVSGSGMLIRWGLLDDLKVMDEEYFLYYEEVDFMLQARRRGWETWFVPSAVFVHEAGSSTGVVGGRVRTGRMPEYWFQSWRRYFAKNHGPAYARFAAVMRLLGLAVGMAQLRLRGRRMSLPELYLQDFARCCLMGRRLPDRPAPES